MHPLGGELRCEIDCEMFGTRASRSLDRLCSMRVARRKAFEAKGWTASGHRGMSLIGSTKSGPQRPSNESHQPTDPAESPRHQVDPGAKNEQRADKIQQPTNALGLHSLGSGKLSALQNRCNREPRRDVDAKSVAVITDLRLFRKKGISARYLFQMTSPTRRCMDYPLEQ